MKKTIITSSLFTVLPLCGMQGASAQVNNTDFDLGDSPFELSIAPRYTDNLNPSLREELSATGLSILPKAQFVLPGDGVVVQAKFNGHYQRFSLSDDTLLLDDSPSFDFSRLKIQGTFFLDPSWYLEAFGLVYDEDQMFGTGISKLRQGVTVSDNLSTTELAAKLVYGSEQAGRYVSVEYSAVSDDYENNEYSDFFDLDQRTLTAELGMKNSDLFRYIIQFQYQDDDFDSEFRVDSQLYRALAGVEWKPSGKSEMYALIGGYRREYDDQSANSGVNWQFAYTFRPRTDLTLALNSARTSLAGEDEFSVNSVRSNFLGKVTYDASEQWQLGAQFSFINTEFDGVEESQDKEIDESAISTFLTLSFKDYHDLTLSLGKRDLEVSDQSLDYTQNEAELIWRYAF